MRRLACRLKLQLSLHGRDRDIAGLRSRGAVEHGHGEVVEPLALSSYPVLKGIVTHTMGIEQRSAILRRGLFPAASFRQLFEGSNVHKQRIGIEADGVMLGAQGGGLACAL